MERFQSLILKAKEDVYTHLQGGNFSRVLGQGYDFSELRSYEPSDDIRHISWINSAKSNELYVKKVHEEREVLVHVSMLIDGRAVIGKKQALMTYALALLAYATVGHNDLFESSFSFGENFKTFEAFKNVENVEAVLKEFSGIEPLGLALDYAHVPKNLLALGEQRSLFFLVGDFFDEIDLSVLAQKHELCVIVVRDRWEENPMPEAEAELLNPLRNSTINQTLSKKALAHYVSKLEAHDAKLYAHFHKHQIKYMKVYEEQEVLGKLEQLFYF